MAQPQVLSARELQHRLGSEPPPLLVDVREPAELAMAAMPQVCHLPLSRSQDWLPRLEDLLPRDRDLVILCHAGVRSWDFGCFLTERLGYERVWNLSGGIDAWSREVDPSVPRY